MFFAAFTLIDSQPSNLFWVFEVIVTCLGRKETSVRALLVMIETTKPGAIFASSCSKINCEEIIKEIIGKNADPHQSDKNYSCFLWNVSTKYYKAEIQLTAVKEKLLLEQSLYEATQAVVLAFDPIDDEEMRSVESWLPFLKEADASIKILLCDNCDDELRKNTLEWCLDHQFELVELNPKDALDSDDESDDFGETTGISRVVQALHSHVWPNMIMKENPISVTPLMQQLMNEAKNEMESSVNGRLKIVPELPKLCADETRTPQADSDAAPPRRSQFQRSSVSSPGCFCSSPKSASPSRSTDSTNSHKSCAMSSDTNDLLDVDDSDVELHDCEEFENLFDKMRLMKEKAAVLPPHERKAYAEKVAIAFWNSIKGDEDEIAGLSDSE